jgi:aerobic-type carbon monoxide dehydrogenase small subunit (CoxS/CutS family)
MKQITLRVNRTTHAVEVDPETPLLFVLNDELGLRGHGFATAWRSDSARSAGD